MIWSVEITTVTPRVAVSPTLHYAAYLEAIPQVLSPQSRHDQCLEQHTYLRAGSLKPPRTKF